MIEYRENEHLEIKDLEALYTSVGWSAYTSDLVGLCRAIEHSLKVITAWDDQKLVGLIRVVGDGFTILYLQDILVHPEYQHRKIGTQLFTQMLENYPTSRQKVLLTEDSDLMRHFYEKFGFASCDQGNLVAFYREF